MIVIRRHQSAKNVEEQRCLNRLHVRSGAVADVTSAKMLAILQLKSLPKAGRL